MSNSNNKSISQKREFYSLCNLENIKSKYNIQNVFNNLSKKKFFEIIKQNNKIKERLDINIKDYKEYSETYTSIEIEIIPIRNKHGQFININEEDELYYHIYFNNNKKEKDIREYILNEYHEIKTIDVIIDYQVKSFRIYLSFVNALNL